MSKCSIIIPAHNEEKTIGDLLDILSGTEDFEVIVVCNGCTDKTATFVRRNHDDVIIRETSIASKAHALQIGDDTANNWPRIYVDADIRITKSSIYSLISILNRTGVLATAPLPQNILKDADWVVRAFYRVWVVLPYYRAGMIGCGVYGLSKKGRERFGKWPALIADDGYIRALFTGKERVICREAIATVYAPKTTANLIKAKTRSRLGRYQLAQKFPQFFNDEKLEKSYAKAFLTMLLSPFLWFSLPVYMLINIITRIRAMYQLKSLDTYKWEQDLSTRV